MMSLNDVKSTLNFQVSLGETVAERLEFADGVYNIAEQIRKTATRDAAMIRLADQAHAPEIRAYYTLLKEALNIIRDTHALERLRADFYPDINETLIKGTHNTRASIRMLGEFINATSPAKGWLASFGVKRPVVNVDEIMHNLG